MSAQCCSADFLRLERILLTLDEPKPKTLKLPKLDKAKEKLWCRYCGRPRPQNHMTYFSRRGKKKIVCVSWLGDTKVIHELEV